MWLSRSGEERSEADHEAEQILKIREVSLPARNELRADIVVSNGFAEGVTQGEARSERDVDSHGDAKSRPRGCKMHRWENGAAAEGYFVLARAGEMEEASADREVRSQAVVSRSEVNQQVEENRMLRALSVLLIKGIGS